MPRRRRLSGGDGALSETADTMTLPRPATRWYGALASVPDPGRSTDDRRRYLHRDLPSLSDTELSRELTIIRLALIRRPDVWLSERAERLRAEGRRRGRQADRRWLP
jgi:hypothetical protein